MRKKTRRQIMLQHLSLLYRAYRYRYHLDPAELKFLLTQLQHGDTAVDIGAHKGGYLYWLQKKVGKMGKVYAFEPQQMLYDYLQNRRTAANWQHVQLENKGLSDQSGKVDFHIPITKSGSSPGARIDLRTDEKARTASIQVTTLDDYFLTPRIIPKLIKIDVEGHEKKVLQGGINLLQQYQPTLLLECENRHLGTDNIFSVFEFLQKIGYQGYFFNNHQQTPIEQFSIEKHQRMGEGRFWEAKGYVNNFVFTKK